ncbi:DNA topoisomerase 1 isoform X1 [Ceratitis capitata]|uniref:DNA topoisomerase 1 isoform X1 n=2 Tax=Ceratitis capitata TaxID=7213 RepID=UPI0003296DF8|nr:DNA topoisomerase 1 isoform X1 [Ceratitis capitata]
MSVDVAPENDIKTQNGSSEMVQVNGVSNGHHSSSSSSSKHKSSSKDKHRDKERDRDRDHKSSSSKDHKSSSRDKDKHHSSSSSSSKDKYRDKDRDGKHSSSSSSSHRDKDRDKDKDKHKSSSSSSSSSHHKSSSKDKDRRDKDRDRKESSSSSSSKDKEKDRHKSSSSSSSRDKDRDRHRSSSSSKHKHSSSSSSKSSSGGRPKILDGEFIKPEPISQPLLDSQSNGYNSDFAALKPEPVGNDYMDESNSGFENNKDGYEEKPDIKMEEQNNINISQASSCDYSMSQFKEDEPSFVVKEEASADDDSMCRQENQDFEDDEEDVPLAMRKTNNNKTSAPTPAEEEDDEEDIPLAKRKIKVEEDDDEDVPLLARKKVKKESSSKSKNKKKRVKEEEEEEYGETKPKKKKTKKVETQTQVKQETASPTKRKKKEEEEDEVWRWWEEEKREDGVKWNTLEHKGPVFAPPYVRVPKNVRFFYDGKPMELSEETEEAATFYAKMLNHDYCTKQIFNDNFFKDFRKTMTSKEREIIKDFKKCNFEEMFNYFTAESEKRKNASKEEKLAKKLENEALIKEYGTCIIDGHKEKIGNFRLEPPGLFRGRGEHPKMGMIKRRIQAGDVSINCGKESKIPSPPPGHRWKEVRHDNTVTWLASWVENVQGQVKYIMLNPSSKLKGEKDHVKYETARRLAKSIDKIRATYRDEWKSKEMRVRQRAVALYFIDKLALRAGNEKDEDQADTVGCCSLRVEHVKLAKQLNGKENVVIFDFLGKDSIRYYNEVEVEKRVFKNLELFLENKKEGDDLFDRLNTQVLNEHLKELMEGLTAKVFRTYNASITLQNQLDLLTEESMSPAEKLLAYNRANRAVAILCNHQRSVPKGHEKSMENLKEKIRQKRELIEDAESEFHDLKRAAKRGSVKERVMADKKGKQLEKLKEQLKKLELQETDRDENKTIALGTSKLNYLDPRITVAWCKKHGVPIEKIFNKTQRNKFMWAIHMAGEDYRF